MAFQPVRTEHIGFNVDHRIHAALSKRAATMNVRPGEYARRLFEAAWLARVSGERGQSSGDVALDNQVRQVFLLADCEPEFIAEAIGIPAARAANIIAGWRTHFAGETVQARETPDGAGAAAGQEGASSAAAPPIPASPPARETLVGGYPVETIRRMWAEGATTKVIARAIGKTEGALSMWASKHRDVCPSRKAGGQS